MNIRHFNNKQYHFAFTNNIFGSLWRRNISINLAVNEMWNPDPVVVLNCYEDCEGFGFPWE